VAFEASVLPHQTSYPSDKYYRYYSGNEAVPAYAAHAAPAPRGNRTKGPGMFGTIHMYAPVLADRLRVRLRKIELRYAERKLIRGDHVVLLRSGGFIFSRALVAQQTPQYPGRPAVGYHRLRRQRHCPGPECRR